MPTSSTVTESPESTTTEEPETKLCRTCGQDKPVDDWPPDGHGRFGPDCRDCWRAKLRAEYAERRPHIRAKAAALLARPDQTAKARARVARWNDSPGRAHGMDPDTYWTLRRLQGDACAVCGTPFSGGRAPDVEHDHDCCPVDQSCGRCVRGVTCNTCNQQIARSNDDPVIARRRAAELAAKLAWRQRRRFTRLGRHDWDAYRAVLAETRRHPAVLRILAAARFLDARPLTMVPGGVAEQLTLF